MKIALNVLGGLLIALGVEWILFGLKMLPFAIFPLTVNWVPMTWMGNGAWAAVFGVGLLVWNHRRGWK